MKEPGRPPQPLQLWVGPEASHVRAGALLSDQQAMSGFGARPGDLERLGSLGASAVRFPLLWEKTAPDPLALNDPDWRWADRALPQLAQLSLRPLVGLVHHGGGPLAGGVLDDGFAPGLARYAATVARRFPWLDAYTPVNEPLTTARFSALYGHWHPHARGDANFLRALLNQLQGTVLAMSAIREVNSHAALVQTEDLGRVYGTPAMQEQVDFENLRRWLSFDLLCGRVDEGHGLWSYLTWAGAGARELLWFAEHPCPPDVLGLNVYPTSERFLDERLEYYPVSAHGGNAGQAYADVEAVRVRPELPGGFYERLTEAHERYGLPLALSEVHLGCTREEQLRWLNSAWQGAQRARQAGADVRAVTAWSAFGSFEWNSLLTRHSGYSEAGLWDVRTDPPRETALARLCRELSGRALSGRQWPGHPALDGPGWWERPDRIQGHTLGERCSSAGPEARTASGRPVQIAAGPISTLLSELCRIRGLPTGDTLPWARLETPGTSRLRLHWLGRAPLEVQVPAGQADSFRALQLHAALDLLIDGETGLWLWNGRQFVQEHTLAVPARVRELEKRP